MRGLRVTPYPTSPAPEERDPWVLPQPRPQPGGRGRVPEQSSGWVPEAARGGGWGRGPPQLRNAVPQRLAQRYEFNEHLPGAGDRVPGAGCWVLAGERLQVGGTESRSGACSWQSGPKEPGGGAGRTRAREAQDRPELLAPSLPKRLPLAGRRLRASLPHPTETTAHLIPDPGENAASQACVSTTPPSLSARPPAHPGPGQRVNGRPVAGIPRRPGRHALGCPSRPLLQPGNGRLLPEGGAPN